MKNNIKIFLASFLVALVIIGCRDEANMDWTKPQASFKLYDVSTSMNVLYPSMKDNPFILTWDDSAAGTGNYSAVVSATDDFQNKVEIGTSTTNTLNTTIQVLNSKLLQAGLSPYNAQTAYIRIEKGSAVSNTISINTTPYPMAKPVITSPTSGTNFVLDINNQSSVISTVKWNDYANYGVNVNYKIGVAAQGATVFQDAGSTANIRQFDWTNKILNDAVLKTGAQPNVASQIDVKVTATTQSTGGTITIDSDVVTITVTPFSNNVTLYLIGDATAGGWDNSVGNANMYPLLGDHNNSTLYTYTGFFKAGGFKIIKDKGSWTNQYGQGSGSGVLDTSGGSGNINITADGYYKVSIDVGNLTYSIVSVTPSSATYATVGIIGDSTANGWGSSTPMTHSAFDSHVWYLTGVSLTTGEMKFRANDNWDVNWGSSDENFGTATGGGPNIPVAAGTYNIYFNDFTGAYVLIKQ